MMRFSFMPPPTSGSSRATSSASWAFRPSACWCPGRWSWASFFSARSSVACGQAAQRSSCCRWPTWLTTGRYSGSRSRRTPASPETATACCFHSCATTMSSRHTSARWSRSTFETRRATSGTPKPTGCAGSSIGQRFPIWICRARIRACGHSPTRTPRGSSDAMPSSTIWSAGYGAGIARSTSSERPARESRR